MELKSDEVPLVEVKDKLTDSSEHCDGGGEIPMIKEESVIKVKRENRIQISKNILNKYEIKVDNKCLENDLTKTSISYKKIKTLLKKKGIEIDEVEVENVVDNFLESLKNELKAEAEAEAEAERLRIESDVAKAEAKAEKLRIKTEAEAERLKIESDKLNAEAEAEVERLKNDTRIKATIKLDFVKEGNLKKVQFEIIPDDLQKHTVSIYGVNGYALNKLVKLENKAIDDAKGMLKVLRKTYSFTADESSVEAWIKNDFSTSQALKLIPVAPVIMDPVQEKTKWLDWRHGNFAPYEMQVSEDTSVPLCNFNITFLKSLIIGDRQFYTIRINFTDIKNGAEDYIEKEVEDIAFSTPQEWIKFITPLANDLWYERSYLGKLLTEINKDQTKCKPFLDVTVKSPDIGWNANGDRYSTQSLDIFLTLNENTTYDEERAGKKIVSIGEGSTKFIDEDYEKIKNMNFTEISDDEFKIVMTYLSGKWLRLNPLVPRLTGFAFVTPFASFYASYIRMVMYLTGRTGYGKTALAKAIASFFGNIKDDKQLIAAKTSIPKISFYAHLYKDCPMVLDNIKEGFLSDKEIRDRWDFISKYADNQAREVMGKTRYGRGTLIVTGEEKPQDASTLRKVDMLTFIEPIDPINAKIKPNVTELSTYTHLFSGVMVRFIKDMLEKYGDAETIGEAIINKTINSPKLSNIGDRILKLNYIGFNFFVEWMVDLKYITVADANAMLKAHLDSLIDVDNYKLDLVSEKTSGQRYISAIKSLIKSNEVNIDNALPNKYKSTIGKALKNGDIVIYDEVYPIIRSKTMHYYELPKDYESVCDQLKTMIKSGEILGEVSKSVKMPNGKTERVITFKPSVFGLEYIVNGFAPSHTTIVNFFNQMLINKGITKAPTNEQVDDLIHLMKPMFSGNVEEARDWVNSALTLKGWVDNSIFDNTDIVSPLTLSSKPNTNKNDDTGLSS